MDVNREQITELYKEIYGLFLNRDFSAVDEKYREFNVEELNMTLLVGLPRLSYMYRDDMTEWKPFLEKCKNEIERRGKDSEELLKGLL